MDTKINNVNNINDNNDNNDNDVNYNDDYDLSWITEFETSDKEYKDFYVDDLMFIKLHVIYLDKDINITNLKEENVFMKKSNLLTREEVLRIIKNNCIYNDIRYNVLSILKYNITLSPHNLKSFLKSKDKFIGANYLTPIRNIDAITFEPTITILQDINELMIIFFEKTFKSLNNLNTLNSCSDSGLDPLLASGSLNSKNNGQSSDLNATKKIHLYKVKKSNNSSGKSNSVGNGKKTLRKQFKDSSIL